jgi:integrase
MSLAPPCPRPLVGSRSPTGVDVATIRKLRGRWQAQVRRKGMAPRAKSFDQKSDAEKWARSLETELDRCGALPDTKVAEATTLAQILTRYRDEVSPRKRSAVSEVARINAILRRDICHRTLALLTTSDVAQYREARLRTVAAATVTRELNTISHAVDTATRDWGIYLPRNPCKLVRRPSAPRGRDRRLLPGEEARLLAAVDHGRNIYLRPLIVLAIETGMRRGELLGLEWKDVDLEIGVAHLQLTKNGEARSVPLSIRARRVLQSLRDERTDTSEARPLPTTASAVAQAWGHLRVRAGMPDLHFHDLRHEAVSRLFERGLNIMEVASISGHKELSMLKRYTHLRAVDLVAKLG